MCVCMYYMYVYTYKEIDIYRHIDIYLCINNNWQQQESVLLIVHNSQRYRLGVISEHL